MAQQSRLVLESRMQHHKPFSEQTSGSGPKPGMMQIMSGKKDQECPCDSLFSVDYVQLGENVRSVLETLRFRKSALRRDLTAALLASTSPAFQAQIMGIEGRYYRHVISMSDPARLSSHPLIVTQRVHEKKNRATIREQEVKAYADTYKCMLGGRSGASTDYFAITDTKDYFYLRYK
jgi:hypothetical protein